MKWSITCGKWSERTEIPAKQLVRWLGIGMSKFHDWQGRYGKVNEHNGWCRATGGSKPGRSKAIIGFYVEYPLEGYRRLTFMMLDADVVAVSPASVYRVLEDGGLHRPLESHRTRRRGTGFQQPATA